MDATNSFLYKYFIQGVVENPLLEREDGGEDCYNEMTFKFKFFANAVMIMLSLYILSIYHKRVVPKVNHPKRRSQAVRKYEIISGLACWLIIVVQIYFKVSTQSLIYIFNPCHISIVSL